MSKIDMREGQVVYQKGFRHALFSYQQANEPSANPRLKGA